LESAQISTRPANVLYTAFIPQMFDHFTFTFGLAGRIVKQTKEEMDTKHHYYNSDRIRFETSDLARW
jgi:hypothetical protein